MNQEKRMRTRVPVHFEVSILLGEEVIRAEIINISLNGILCTSNPLFQNNALCKVIVPLSDDIQIVVDSKILRVGERECAIRFISMDDESFIHLRKLVQYNMGDADRIDKELHKKAFD
ncbi:MAG: PilZ domain-containing protein [Deltaproteobacteria bacterium]|nr:MAG: PilZ domain-containing protein [Deltaproteobacteria bacterium]